MHERAYTLAAELGVEPEAPLVRSRAVAALAGDFEAARAATAHAAAAPAPRTHAARAAPGDPRAARGAPRRGGDDVLLVEGEWILAIAAYWSGRLEAARRHLEAALANWRPEHRAEHLLRYGQDTELTSRIRLAHTLQLLGDREAAARTREATLAGLGAHAHTRAIVHLWATLMALDERDEATVRVHAQAVIEHARGPAERPAEALAGFLDVLDGGNVERTRRVVEAATRSEPAAPGEHGLLARVLVEACARAGDAEAGRRGLRARAAHEQRGAALDGRDRAPAERLRARGTVRERLGGDAAAR